jgi:hypothetical protein
MTTRITELGGFVNDTKLFESSCTHLIAGNTFRNEKLLGSIASGIWILEADYVDDCYKAQRWLHVCWAIPHTLIYLIFIGSRL